MTGSENKQNSIAVVMVIVVLIGIVVYFHFWGQTGVANDIGVANDSVSIDGRTNDLKTDAEVAEDGSGEVIASVDDESVASEVQWSTYVNEEWKFSFEYPSNYIITEELEGVKISVSPPESEFEGPSTWFMVWVVQYPSEELLEDKELNEYLFNRANLPNGKVAWLKDERFFPYENYFVSKEEIVFGQSTEVNALQARENSINPNLGEYRNIVYVLREPVIYRVTHDLSAEDNYADILKRVEDSFTVIE